MPEDESRLFIEIRGVGPSDFPIEEHGHPTEEAVALANDTHDLVQEEYDAVRSALIDCVWLVSHVFVCLLGLPRRRGPSTGRKWTSVTSVTSGRSG